MLDEAEVGLCCSHKALADPKGALNLGWPLGLSLGLPIPILTNHWKRLPWEGACPSADGSLLQSSALKALTAEHHQQLGEEVLKWEIWVAQHPHFGVKVALESVVVTASSLPNTTFPFFSSKRRLSLFGTALCPIKILTSLDSFTAEEAKRPRSGQ